MYLYDAFDLSGDYDPTRVVRYVQDGTNKVHIYVYVNGRCCLMTTETMPLPQADVKAALKNFQPRLDKTP